MSRTAKIEREVCVFTSWTICGLLGLGFLLEGGARESFVIGSIGIGAIVVGFIAHLIANYVFGQDFTKGEAALGLGIYAVTACIFIIASLSSALSLTAITLGIVTLIVVAAGFVSYLLTRFGARGAFNKFDAASQAISGHRK